MMRDHEDLEGLEFLRLLTEQVLSPIAWLLEGDYQEPSAELKPFVYALMNRAIKGDEDAVAALMKLFPPRLQS